MSLPKLAYHLIEAQNWQSIQRRGLLPSEQLIREAFPTISEQTALISSHRKNHTVLPTGVHVRDQKPMPPAALKACLIGMTPAEWYALVNAHVFFWFDRERANRQRAACAGRAQYLAVVRTEALIGMFGDFSYVTPFNVGYALRRPAKRGERTLVPYKTWLVSRWQSETSATGSKPRSATHEPAELLIRAPIPEFTRLIQSLIKLEPGQSLAPCVRPHC